MANRFTYMGKPDSYNAYAAGAKVYGIGGRGAPTVGPVDKTGYKKRDAEVRLKRNAMLRRLKAGNAGKYMSSDWLGGKNV
jgi:hypothetical protein